MVTPLAVSPDGQVARPRLLGDGGDVTLIDGRHRGHAELRRVLAGQSAPTLVGVLVDGTAAVAVAASGGAALIHVPTGIGAAPEVCRAARAGVVVVIGGELRAAHRVAQEVVAAGGDPTRIVVEVSVTPDGPVPTADDVAMLASSTVGLGAELVSGATTMIDSASRDEADGWEVGALICLFRSGARMIRGVDPARFRRVLAVAQALTDQEQGP